METTARRFVHCRTCNAILGYTAEPELKLYIYGCPPLGVRGNLDTRRIAGKITSGEVLCPHCDTWQKWEPQPIQTA